MIASVKMVVTHSFKLFSTLFVVLVLIICSKGAERKIQLQKYHCPLHKDNITIVYITATDNAEKNTVHFIWSVYETPSIIVGYTSKYNFVPHSSLNIDCNKLTSNDPKKAIKWKYDYVSAFEIPEVEELYDPKDGVIFKDFAKTKKHNIYEAIWKTPTFTKDQVTFEGDFLEGKISFMLNSSSEDGRGAEPPRQLYSNNGTRFSITLDKSKFNTTKTRVAFKLLTHTERHPKSTILEDRSIDDEFSPGVFRTFVINHVLNSTLSSFVSWKPVSYMDNKKDLDTQIPSYQYNYEDPDKYSLYKPTDPTKPTTLVSSSKDKPSKIIQAAIDVHKTFPMMISFGQTKDGWYQKNHYLTWSGQVGYFKPQFDSMSKTLMVTIFVGLGLPVAFILVGSIYVCVKKYRERMTTSTYGKIN